MIATLLDPEMKDATKLQPIRRQYLPQKCPRTWEFDTTDGISLEATDSMLLAWGKNDFEGSRYDRSMGTLHELRSDRSDLTDYVIHLTRMVLVTEKGRNVDVQFNRLKNIVKMGVLRPTRGFCDSFLRGGTVRTIKGEHKAVCFTEQPLDQILTTLYHLGGAKYMGYGIALHKADLFEYGGRQAIYGDDAMLDMLPAEFKYLWVRYRPRRQDDDRAVDFTCEREWRARLSKMAMPWGHPLPGIPLILPEDFRRIAKRSPFGPWKFQESCSPDFRVIVRWDVDVAIIRTLIEEVAEEPATSQYERVYRAALRNVQVISLEHVERKSEAEDSDEYRRIEDLPFPEDIVPLNPKKKEWPFLK